MPSTQTVDDPTGAGWEQPPFDRRITSLPMLALNDGDSRHGWGTIQRGYIKQAAGNAAGSSQQTTSPDGFVTSPRTVQFLYNPSSVSVSHAVSTSDAALDPSMRSSLDDGQLTSATGATVSFSLLFDRTYEVSDETNFGTRVGEKGVAVDVEALYALTGILQLNYGLPSGSPLASTQFNGTANQNKAETIALQLLKEQRSDQILGIIPSEVITIQEILAKKGNVIGAPDGNADQDLEFLNGLLEERLKAAGLSLADVPGNADSFTSVSSGHPAGWPFTSPATQFNGQTFGVMSVQPVIAVFGRQRTGWSPSIEYYGYISSLDIEYAHWTQNGVPSRCAVSINMALLPTTADQMMQAALWNGGS